MRTGGGMSDDPNTTIWLGLAVTVLVVVSARAAAMHLTGGGPASLAVGVAIGVGEAVLIGAAVWGVHRLAGDGSLAAQRRRSHRWAARSDMAGLITPTTTRRRLCFGRFHSPGHRSEKVWGEPGRSKLIMAPSGSGKTPRIVVPDVLTHRGPVLVTSVKFDVYNLTRAHRARMGRVLLFNPAHPDRSLRWSPLESVTDWSSALRAASYLTSSSVVQAGADMDFWNKNAENLLGPLMMAAADTGKTMVDIGGWLFDFDRVAGQLTRSLRQRGHTDAANRLASVSASAPELRDSVLTTARTIFTSWAHPDIARAVDVHAGQTGPDVLHVDDLIHSMDALYLVASASEQQLFAPVFETLVNAVYRQVEEAYETGGSHPLDPPLLLALDEAGNIAPIKRLPEIASAGGGQGALLESVWQDEGQIIARYGRDQAAVVMSNHWGRVYMPGISDERSLKTLSELIGRDEMHTVSWSTDTWGRMNTSRSSHEVEVAPVADLKTMKADETIVIMGRHKPARLHQPGWWELPELRRLVPTEVAAAFDADYGKVSTHEHRPRSNPFLS